MNEKLDEPMDEASGHAPTVEKWCGEVVPKRIVDVMYGPVYVPPKWEPPRAESEQYRQYTSRGVRC